MRLLRLCSADRALMVGEIANASNQPGRYCYVVFILEELLSCVSASSTITGSELLTRT